MLLHESLDSAPFPGKPAVIDRSGTWSYRELMDHSRAVAAWLVTQGVGRGDRVVVKAVADRRIPALLYGCSRIGAVFVPISETLTPHQVSHVLSDAKPATVVDDIDAVWPTIATCSESESATAPSSADDPLILFYTSGSTAAQKAVVAPHHQIHFASAAIQQRLGYRDTDTVFCRLPLNFDYGLYQVILSVLARSTLVLANAADDPRIVINLRKWGATVIPVVPALALMLVRLARKSAPLTGVRLFTNTGEDLPMATIDKLTEVFPDAAVQLMFGLTECKRVSILEPDGYLERPGSVGRPLTGTSVTIVDDHDREVETGAVGEILVHGPHVADGYWRAPELTGQRFTIDAATSQPTLRTGDMGYVDAEGYLYFQGRRDHVFKHRGIRTSVVEIETALAEIPQVTEAVVVPPRDGGPLTVYAISALDSPELLKELNTVLGPQRLPDICHIVDSLPRGPNGKVDRAALRRGTWERES